MGISDDIRPKRVHHQSEKSDHVPIFSDIQEDDDEPIEYEKELDRKSLEKLEDDFFDNKDFRKAKKVSAAKEEKPTPKKHKPKKSLTRVTIWLMTILLIAILVWQNRSEILSFVKTKILKIESVDSLIEKEKTEDEYYTAESSTDNTSTTPATTESEETSSSTAAAPVEVNKAAVIIEVLNGNGIKNSADKVKAQLIAAGFKVSRVANAKNFNYATSNIYFKTGKNQEAELIKQTLTSLQTTTQNNDSIVGDYDIVIVVGAK